MSSEPQRTGSGERERMHERAPDPAEAVDKPLESKWSERALHERDEPHLDADAGQPHSRLNSPVGEPDPNADSDPYEAPGPDDDADRASGTRGVGEDEQ